MGFEVTKRPAAFPGERQTSLINSATSAGCAVPWNRTTLMAANTSAGSVPLNIGTMAAGKPGDRAFITANVPTSSAGAVLRLPSTAAFFEGSTGTRDSLLFYNGNLSVELVCLSTARYLAIGASTGMYQAST